RRWQVTIEPGLRCAIIGAEPQHDADLVRQHPVKAACRPQHDDRGDDDRDAGAGTEATRQHAAKTILTAPQELFEIRRLRAARTSASTTAAAAAPGSAAGTAAAARPGAPRSAAVTVP